MERLFSLFEYIAIGLTVFGLVVLLVLSFIGGKMVLSAINFAVAYSLAEYRSGKLARASAEARDELKKKYKMGEYADDVAEEPPRKTNTPA